MRLNHQINSGIYIYFWGVRWGGGLGGWGSYMVALILFGCLYCNSYRLAFGKAVISLDSQLQDLGLEFLSMLIPGSVDRLKFVPRFTQL